MNGASLDTAADAVSSASKAAWPTQSTAYYTLFALVLCASSYLLAVAIVPYPAATIKADLHLSDTTLGLLFGLSFGLFYTLVGLPIAHFIDRCGRRWILAIGLAVWNIGTALCAAAQNFTQLFTARLLVGAGESVNGPTSYAIIGKLFPRDKMTRAIALLHLGDVVGPAIALLFGALLLHIFLGIKPIHVPFGVIHGWQIVFIRIGLPSLIISALILTTVPEPKRRAIRNPMGQLKGHNERLSDQRRSSGHAPACARPCVTDPPAQGRFSDCCVVRAHGRCDRVAEDAWTFRRPGGLARDLENAGRHFLALPRTHRSLSGGRSVFPFESRTSARR